MALRIRLRQHGRKNHRVYRIVVSDVCSPREGRYVDCVGWYDPFAKSEPLFVLNSDKVMHWVQLGALPTDSVVPFMRKSAQDALDLMRTRKEVARNNRKTQRRRAAQRKKQRLSVK